MAAERLKALVIARNDRQLLRLAAAPGRAGHRRAHHARLPWCRRPAALAVLSWLESRVADDVQVVLARQRAQVAREIADAIRATAPRPCDRCDTYPDCLTCARSDQAKAAVSLALRAGQS